jgi:hypothetical protein
MNIINTPLNDAKKVLDSLFPALRHYVLTEIRERVETAIILANEVLSTATLKEPVPDVVFYNDQLKAAIITDLQQVLAFIKTSRGLHPDNKEFQTVVEQLFVEIVVALAKARQLPDHEISLRDRFKSSEGEFETSTPGAQKIELPSKEEDSKPTVVIDENTGSMSMSMDLDIDLEKPATPPKDSQLLNPELEKAQKLSGQPIGELPPSNALAKQPSNPKKNAKSTN